MKPVVLSLLDQMEDLIAAAPALPIGGRIIVARDALLEYIDAMRMEALELAEEQRLAGDGRSR